jgi:hypothetical protein
MHDWMITLDLTAWSAWCERVNNIRQRPRKTPASSLEAFYTTIVWSRMSELSQYVHYNKQPTDAKKDATSGDIQRLAADLQNVHLACR